VAHQCSEAAVGSSGQEGWRRGPATVGGDIGGEGPPGRGERSARVELTVEGENGSGLKYGEGWRHDHGSALLNCAMGGRGKGAGVRGQCPCGGGRRKERGGGLVWQLAAWGDRQWPSTVGRGCHRATWIGEPKGGGLTDGPWPQCRTAAPTDRRTRVAQCRVQMD
jgi:hypothetical protein